MGKKSKRHQSGQVRQPPNQQQHAATDADKPPSHEKPERSAVEPSAACPQPPNDQHRATERRFWERQIRVAKWLNGITFGAAIAGFLGIFFVYLSLVEAKDALEQDQRAWINPLPPEIVGSIAAPMLIKIPYENTGRSVAINTVVDSGWRTFDVVLDGTGNPYIDRDTNDWPNDKECTKNIPPPVHITQGTASKTVTNADIGVGIFVYPGSQYTTIRYVINDPHDPIVDKMSKKIGSIAIFGCFSYLTFNKTKHSPFCFYWQPYRDKDVKDATFLPCPISISTISAD